MPTVNSQSGSGRAAVKSSIDRERRTNRGPPASFKAHGVVPGAKPAWEGTKDAADCKVKCDVVVGAGGEDSCSKPSEQKTLAMRLPFQNKLITLLELSNQEPELEEDPEHKLNLVMGVVIVFNTIVMAAEIDFGPKGYAEPGDRLGWYLVESVFLTIFIIELFIRVYWQRSSWVCSAWNWFDLAIVLTAMVETWFVPVFVGSDVEGLRTLTLLRIVRLLKLVRIVRLIRFFRPLYIVLRALRAALASILYIGAIMMLGLFVVAIFVAATVGNDPALVNKDMGGYTGRDRFGTVADSMYSLFELMTLEGWENVGRPIVMERPVMALFLFAFIVLFTFGMLNMVVALVVEKTMRETKELTEMGANEQLGETAKLLLQLQQAISHVPVDADGRIAMETMRELLQEDPNVREKFEAVDVPTADFEFLFALIDVQGRGSVTPDEVVEACAQIQGALDPGWERLQRQVVMQTHGHNLNRQLDMQAETLSRLDGLEASVARIEETLMAMKGGSTTQSCYGRIFNHQSTA